MSFAFFFVLDFWHEEISIERESWAESLISRQATSRDAMFIGTNICKVWEWSAGVSHLDIDRERRCHGYVEE